MLPVTSRLYRDTESNYHERWRTANCDGLYIGCGQLPPSPPHWRHFSVVSVLYTYCVILLTCLFADSMHETKVVKQYRKILNQTRAVPNPLTYYPSKHDQWGLYYL